MAATPKPKRAHWSSGLGFVLAAAGSAIGLGNIWRFPYSAGEHGGAAFVLVYLLCVICLGLPVMLVEVGLGRSTQRNPVGAILFHRPTGPWRYLGYLAIATGLGILSFYAVIAGQVTAEFVDCVQSVVTDRPLMADFGPAASLSFFAVFVLLTVLVVAAGVQHGIERWAKILMPILLVMMIGIIVRGLLLPGSMEGVRWLVMPDFGRLGLGGVLDAMAQAFFSLSLGMGAMLTYGSYLTRENNVFRCGAWVVGMDTGIAMLAGLMIFPALFALGQQPDGGPDLIFQVLPAVFAGMPGGAVVGSVFFFLLGVAALTSTISLLEVVTAYFVDERGWSRRRAVWSIGLATFVVGIPSALAWVGVKPLATARLLGQEGFFGLVDFLFVNISLPLGALLLCVFATVAWGLRSASDEIGEGSPLFQRIAPLWRVFVAVVCPVCIFVILLTRIFG